MGFWKGTLENLVILNPEVWKDRSVMVTGHTGFKGGWLSLWLYQLCADIHGYALNPPTNPNLFEVARIKSCLASDTRADVADLDALKSVYNRAQPEIVFHLAAQPLVRESYRDPLETFATNIIGTANVLEAARSCDSVKVIVVVTTDKVYADQGSGQPYCEDDPLGGHDPYSSSKAAAEIVTTSYRKSFFQSSEKHHARIATVRSGNVIGGGDWSPDRLVPDCVKAFINKEPVLLRYPKSVRPWQHVLEPISGYLLLAERLFTSSDDTYARAWNFAPGKDSDADVNNVAEIIAQLWGDGAQVMHAESEQNPYEAAVLRLDSSLARSELGWKPQWSLQQALHATIDWYSSWLAGDDMRVIMLKQISDYVGQKN